MRVFGGKSKQMFCNYTGNVKPQGQNQIEGTYIECRDTNSLSKKGTANISCTYLQVYVREGTKGAIALAAKILIILGPFFTIENSVSISAND